MSHDLSRYFDYNATSPLLPVAREALIAALDAGFGNPSSAHWAGRRSRRILDEARHEIAILCGAKEHEVFFTSGATESLTQALHSHGPGPVVATSLEHPALFGAARALGARPVREVTVRLATPPSGALSVESLLDEVAAHMVSESNLVAMMAAHNVTGLALPVERIGHDRTAKGFRTLVDASQHAGRIPFDILMMPDNRPDFMVLAAHKLGGPKGIGALVIAPGAPCRALFPGGGQEGGQRGGTEAVPLIAAFGAAARFAREHQSSEMARLGALRDRLEDRLAACSGVAIIGRGAIRLPQTSAVIVPPTLDGETVVARMNRLGFALSAGSACSTGSALPSPALVGLGLSPSEALRMIRISLGFFTTPEAVEALADALTALFSSPENH